MAAFLKDYFRGNGSAEDVDAVVVKEKNAQIADEVFVDGAPVYQDASGAPVENVR